MGSSEDAHPSPPRASEDRWVSALDLAPVEGGTRLRLRVRAGARRDALLGVHGGALKLGVTRAPEKGKANDAVLRLLARALGLAPSSLSWVAGRSSPDKIVRVPLSPAQLRRRLSQAPAVGLP